MIMSPKSFKFLIEPKPMEIFEPTFVMWIAFYVIEKIASLRFR